VLTVSPDLSVEDPLIVVDRFTRMESGYRANRIGAGGHVLQTLSCQSRSQHR